MNSRSVTVKRFTGKTSKPKDDLGLFNCVFVVPKPVSPKRIGKIPVVNEY